MKRYLIVALTFALASCSSKNGTTDPVNPGNGTNTVTISFVGTGGAAVTMSAELATTRATRGQGLMERSAASIGVNGGMLFVFPEDQAADLVGFYMVDTPTPLTVVFVDKDMKLMNSADMEPNTSIVHTAAGPFRYAIEVNLGWLDAHGIKTGSKATFTLPGGTIVDPCCP